MKLVQLMLNCSSSPCVYRTTVAWHYLRLSHHQRLLSPFLCSDVSHHKDFLTFRVWNSSWLNQFYLHFKRLAKTLSTLNETKFVKWSEFLKNLVAHLTEGANTQSSCRISTLPAPLIAKLSIYSSFCCFLRFRSTVFGIIVSCRLRYVDYPSICRVKFQMIRTYGGYNFAEYKKVVNRCTEK